VAGNLSPAAALPVVTDASEATMRKLIAWLDDEQREALLELADFGTAAFSAGLATALLKGIVDFVALFV